MATSLSLHATIMGSAPLSSKQLSRVRDMLLRHSQTIRTASPKRSDGSSGNVGWRISSRDLTLEIAGEKAVFVRVRFSSIALASLGRDLISLDGLSRAGLVLHYISLPHPRPYSLGETCLAC